MKYVMVSILLLLVQPSNADTISDSAVPECYIRVDPDYNNWSGSGSMFQLDAQQNNETISAVGELSDRRWNEQKNAWVTKFYGMPLSNFTPFQMDELEFEIRKIESDYKERNENIRNRIRQESAFDGSNAYSNLMKLMIPESYFIGFKRYRELIATYWINRCAGITLEEKNRALTEREDAKQKEKQKMYALAAKENEEMNVRLAKEIEQDNAKRAKEKNEADVRERISKEVAQKERMRQNLVVRGLSPVTNFQDAIVKFTPKDLSGIMTSPLLRTDSAVYSGDVLLDEEVQENVLRVKVGCDCMINIPGLGSKWMDASYAILRISKSSVAFSQNAMRIGGSIKVIGRYVQNTKLSTVAGVGKTVPVLEVMYIGD